MAVADGQCMMIVENGEVVEVCAEPGEFVYDTGTEPSVFTGNLGDMVKKSFEQVGRRAAAHDGAPEIEPDVVIPAQIFRERR